MAYGYNAATTANAKWSTLLGCVMMILMFLRRCIDCCNLFMAFYIIRTRQYGDG